MATKIFVNLPVKNFKKAIHFFVPFGFFFQPQFTDETAAFANQEHQIVSATTFNS